MTGFPGHIIRQYAGIELVFSDQGSGSQAFGRVAGSDGDFHLAKDRTIIKFRRDDMDGAACNIVTCLQCALMRVEALIFGEARWMNVEHPALPFAYELDRKSVMSGQNVYV